jgi:periplasmic protein CpxP/Spy
LSIFVTLNCPQSFHSSPMKKITLTAITTAICSFSIATSTIMPSVAQQPSAAPTTAPTTAPAAAPTPANNPQAQLIEQLKITKDQKIKLDKLEQNFRQKYIAIFTPSQKEQLKIAYQQGKPPGFTLSPDQETKLKAVFTSVAAERDAIFTPEQKRKLQEFNKKYAPKP